MALRLITGRSGQGKTEYLVQEVIRLSMENPQQKYYVIVPEQFSLEMQRKMFINSAKFLAFVRKSFFLSEFLRNFLYLLPGYPISDKLH